MPVEFTAKDERSIRIPVPANAEQTREFARWLASSSDNGYTIKSATEISGGSQYDPYVVGLQVTMERSS